MFRGSFERALVKALRYDPEEAKIITQDAGKKYREIVEKLPAFEKEDRFKTNILSCAQFIAFLSSMPRRPDVSEASRYYEDSMSTAVTRKMCRMGGKNKFSDKDIASMKKTAALKAADRNPYSWNMDYLPYEDGSGYEARFYKCGICTLMKEYGFYDLVPAMCRLDYTMSDMGGTTVFVREYTLASGGPYCDCGYKRK